MSKFMDCKGQFLKVIFTTTKAPAAAHKDTVTLTKKVTMVARAGINFANLGVVKDGIAEGSRGPVQSLPWGEWDQFPYTIKHKNEMYYRLYPVPGNVPKVIYMVNGSEVDKVTWMGFLTPGEANKMMNGEAPECITVKAVNCEFPE